MPSRRESRGVRGGTAFAVGAGDMTENDDLMGDAELPQSEPTPISPMAYSVRAPSMSATAFLGACAALWVAGGAMAMAAAGEPASTLVESLER